MWCTGMCELPPWILFSLYKLLDDCTRLYQRENKCKMPILSSFISHHYCIWEVNCCFVIKIIAWKQKYEYKLAMKSSTIKWHVKSKFLCNMWLHVVEMPHSISWSNSLNTIISHADQLSKHKDNVYKCKWHFELSLLCNFAHSILMQG